MIDNRKVVIGAGEFVNNPGCLHTNEAQTELQGNDALEIERIYVLKDYHGLKVGQLLYQYALDFATELNIKRIWLGVWEENKRAIRFYEKNGSSHLMTLMKLSKL